MDPIIFKGSNVTIRERRLANPAPILNRLGAMMRARVKKTFQDQGRDEVRWKPRGVPNVIGIIKDMEMGRKSIPNRRFEPRPAGIDTRLLARSISYQTQVAGPGSGTAIIGSTVAYASQVQQGGRRVVRISSVARNNLRALVEAARRRIPKRDTSIQKNVVRNQRDSAIVRLGWLLFRSQVKIDVPPRPFVFISHQDRRDIGDMVRAYVVRPGQPPGYGVRE